ncbi:MAG: epoxyqueuosine reductase [Clostridia bacterium]|nr:epoxyqueuosine reductase [Clostridia bacterium]
MIKTTITDILSKTGIKNVGFCAFNDVKEHLLECRAKERLPKNSKTIIICVFPYKVKENEPKFLSRYAAIPDYHTVCGEMLSAACKKLKEKYPQNEFEYFCDNSPIPEVHTAAVSGLGVKGDNGLLITKEYGSFVFLGEIVTDLHIDCENEYNECIHCGKCKTACPVKLDKTKCLSNLSQKKKLVDRELKTLKQNNILWGCDICQNICPMNKNAQKTYINEFINGYRNEYSPGEDTANRPYTWRGESVIKRNYDNLIK